jgi:Bacteriocin-protection, YdeI or OmpD-Associated
MAVCHKIHLISLKNAVPTKSKRRNNDRFTAKFEPMPNSISDKLRIKSGYTLLTLNAPASFKKGLLGLPSGVKIVMTGKEYQQVHWFVENKAQLEKELDKVLKLVYDEVICWIYYPKGTSKLQTDLTRDKGWDQLLKHQELQWISLISFDDTWSTFAFRLKTETDRKKEANPKERTVFEFVDPKTKTVRLPDDLDALLKKNKKAFTFFNSLSFTNKKEYIEWVVTAKRQETREERLKGTMERLTMEWKNPRNL